MESLRLSNKKNLTSGFEENYYRVIFALFGLAFLFSYFYSSPGPSQTQEFLIPRHFFALLPLSLAAITYFSKWMRDHIKDVGSGYFLICSLYLIGFLTLNGFHTHYEIGIITLVLISNLHLNKVLYIVLYNVIVLTALEFVFITASPEANIQPVLFFIFLLLVMLLCIFYQLYRIRYYNNQNESDQLIQGLISGNPDAWMIFEAPGMVAKDAGTNALILFEIKDTAALEQVSLRTLIAAGTSYESDNIIKNILSGVATGIKTQCRKQSGELFWTDISAFRIPGRTNYVYCRFLDISENKWSQENAAESAIRYRSYLDLASEGIIVCDTDGMIKMVNKTALLMLDANNNQPHSGKSIDEVLESEIAEELLRKFKSISTGGKSGDANLTNREGTLIFTVEPVNDVIESKLDCVIKINHNTIATSQVDDVKNDIFIEEKNLEQWEQLLLNSTLPVAIAGNNNYLTESNDHFANLLGYNQAELSKLSMENLVHPEDLKQFRAHLNQLSNQPGAVALTLHLIAKNGKSIIVHCNCSLTATADGNYKVVFILHDITDFKNTETALEEAGSNVTAVIENSDAPIFSIDFNYRIAVMNSAFNAEIQKRTGKTPAIGDDFRQYIPNEIKSKWENTIGRVMKGGKVVEDESITYPDNSIDYFETSYFPISTADRLIIGVSVLSRKVSERMRIEQELIRAKEQAESATTAKSDFLSTMSHEIRTPLNGLLGMTDLLNETSLDQDQKEYLDAIKLSGEALLSVINDVLDYSRIESGKMELEDRPFDLSTCVRETLDILRYKALEKENRLSFDIDDKLPAFISGDKARLRQILVNLVGNAIKFTEHGAIAVNAELVELKNGIAEIKFSVTDTGIGMTEEQMSRLFKSFSQADISTFGKYGGSGLGLSISQKIVTLMQGDIWVESTSGKGSVFYFTIKAKALKTTASSTQTTDKSLTVKQSVQASEDKSTATHYPLHILIAEDNPVNQQLVQKLFQKLGYEPVIAANGKEAVVMQTENNFDIIFMDVQMPVMDGIEATSIILSQSTTKLKPVIVAMTAFALEGDREKCINAGMNDYISKPIHLDNLKDIIRKWGTKKPVTSKSTAEHRKDLVDMKIINRLVAMAEDDPSFLPSLIQLYTQQSLETIEEIYHHSSTNDLTALTQAAHKLKGSSLNMGAKMVADICGQIEEAVMKQDLKSAEEPLKKMRVIYQETLDALKQIIGIR